MSDKLYNIDWSKVQGGQPIRIVVVPLSDEEMVAIVPPDADNRAICRLRIETRYNTEPDIFMYRVRGMLTSPWAYWVGQDQYTADINYFVNELIEKYRVPVTVEKYEPVVPF